MFIKKSLNLNSIFYKNILIIFTTMMTSSLLISGENSRIHYKNIPDKSSEFDGIYFGLTGGMNFDRNDVNIKGKTSCNVNVFNDLNFSSRSVSGGVVLGYGKIINNIYGGIEVIGELSSHKSKNRFGNQSMMVFSLSSQLKQKSNVIVTANIGKQFDEKTLIYGKFGASSSQYTLSTDIKNEVGTCRIPANFSKNFRIVQPVLGIGVERKIMNLTSDIPVYTSAEYRKTIGKSRKINISSGSFVGEGKIKSSSDSISLRVLFRL